MAKILDQKLLKKALSYIDGYWEESTRSRLKDEGEILGLPNPYIVPNLGFFETMFYWDSYFCLKALLQKKDLVRGIIENFFYEIDKYGFVLNANAKEFTKRSQPPLLAFMVSDYLKVYEDEEIFKKGYKYLKKEYLFWNKKPHLTSCGLSRYIDGTKTHGHAEDESGWDRTPRFMGECMFYCPVDLNAFLFYYEVTLSFFAVKLGKKTEAQRFKNKAKARKILINKYFYNKKDGFYYDYNFVKDELSPIKSLAPYTLMWVGALDKKKAKKLASLQKWFLSPGGLVTCDRDYGYNNLQWNYPNAWPPLQYMAVEGLKKYGYHTQAREISYRYVKMNLDLFKKDGTFWEKYDAVSKKRGFDDFRYPTQKGFGWSCAVFLLLLKNL